MEPVSVFDKRDYRRKEIITHCDAPNTMENYCVYWEEHKEKKCFWFIEGKYCWKGYEK